jgi:hypothetical protein
MCSAYRNALRGDFRKSRRDRRELQDDQDKLVGAATRGNAGMKQ